MKLPNVLCQMHGPAHSAWPVALFIALICLPALSQITFTATQLPQVPGQYEREYVTSNSNPSSLYGTSGGPQVWDFSYGSQPGDIVRRLDIVLPTDGGNQASFPAATYAERYTNEDGSLLEWDYYNISSNSGRLYYGSAVFIPASTINIYSPPENDIPATLAYGSNWTYNTSVSYGGITLNSSANASVDAFGSIILPQIGTFKTLRIDALATTVEYLGPNPIATYYVREYYWLVPGLGMAAHILSPVSNTAPPTNFVNANEVRRVFETNSTSVSGLRLQLQKGTASLTWNFGLSASNYQVQAISNLAMTNWAVLASPVSNSWSEFASGAQQFYRVYIQP